MEKTRRASLELSLSWRSQYAVHTEKYFLQRVNFWRDIFPGTMGDKVLLLQEGECCQESFNPGELVPLFEKSNIVSCKEKAFEKQQGMATVTPLPGRFYPRGFAWTVLDCFRGDKRPFRVLDNEQGKLVCDTNHPLAAFLLTLEAKIVQKRPSLEEHGGMCHHIAEIVTSDGPGMQIPGSRTVTCFYPVYPFERVNEGDDKEFYSTPRLVEHLDKTAIGRVEELYSRVLDSGAKILDLMAGWSSHLPGTLKDFEATGLGMNEEELQQNRQLSGYVVHDLNRNPILPFDDNAFDAVLCTVSIEYLTRPLEVIQEVARVVRPGGVFIVTFSDRWFPGKEIRSWSEMHPFERQGLVLDYFLKAEAFENLHTESIRGFLRPEDDKYRMETILSDPVFAVWGNVKR